MIEKAGLREGRPGGSNFILTTIANDFAIVGIAFFGKEKIADNFVAIVGIIEF